MSFYLIDKDNIFINKQIKTLEQINFKDLDYTWRFSEKLYRLNNNIDFLSFYVQGKKLEDVCPEKYKNTLEYFNKRFNAFLNAALISKIKINEISIINLIPNTFLEEYCLFECHIFDELKKDLNKPKSYSFYIDGQLLLNKIKQQSLNIDLEYLKQNLYNKRARDLYELIKNNKIYNVDYNLFGTKTGRLTTKKTSFPILTLDNKFRDILKPNNDFFVEMDFNAAELRVLFALDNKDQPKEDIHLYNANRLNISRDDAKKYAFSVLYGSSKTSFLDGLIDIDEVCSKYYKDGKVTNFFGRQIESDDFHKLNHIIQSTTNDMVLRQAIKINHFLEEKKLKSKISFIIHDAIIFDFCNGEYSHLKDIFNIFCNTCFDILPANVHIGKSFGKMEKIDETWDIV